MFGAAGVREAGAGMGITARRAHVRLRASGGPPAGSVSLGLTHLHAAAADFRFSAMAIAAARGNATQQGRRVAKKRKRAGEKANCGAKQT